MMVQKRTFVTHMRVKSDVKVGLHALKFTKETDAEFLKRVLDTFGNRGIPREINGPIRKLIQVTNTYVCPELDEPLQHLQAILVGLSRETNQEAKVHEARVIGNFLRKRLEGIQKSLEDYK